MIDTGPVGCSIDNDGQHSPLEYTHDGILFEVKYEDLSVFNLKVPVS